MFNREKKRKRREEKRRQIVSACAAQLGWTEEEVSKALPDIDELAYDSLDVAELIAELEEEFGADN